MYQLTTADLSVARQEILRVTTCEHWCMDTDICCIQHVLCYTQYYIVQNNRAFQFLSTPCTLFLQCFRLKWGDKCLTTQHTYPVSILVHFYDVAQRAFIQINNEHTWCLWQVNSCANQIIVKYVVVDMTYRLTCEHRYYGYSVTWDLLSLNGVIMGAMASKNTDLTIENI